jgi:hypothetical protein
LVFPIPPGVRWQEVRAIEVPAVNKDEGGRMMDEGKAKARKVLPAPRAGSGSSFIPHPSSLPHMVAIIVGGRIKYVPKPGTKVEPEKIEKPKRVRKAKEKEALTFDPRFLKQNRELRDRFLERVNGEPLLLEGGGKYDVSRALPAPPAPMRRMREPDETSALVRATLPPAA